MYSVLVADDNSNIQKMVSLALKDEGIEVVAVGNGEAAVRKLGPWRPDLILADIFMPVRNGYEVCEYVKKDARFADIPVILLVGAFDPLDDEEVRRVRADGVLKKPFVPPEPLITLVKSTLERLPKRQPEAAPAIPVSAAQAPPAVAEPPAPEPEPEPEEFQARPQRLEFGGEERPLAFSSLLDHASAKEEAEAEPASHSLPFEASSAAGMETESSPASYEPRADPDLVLSEWTRQEQGEGPRQAEGEIKPPEDMIFAPSARAWEEEAPVAPPAGLEPTDVTLPEPPVQAAEEFGVEAAAPQPEPVDTFSPPGPAAVSEPEPAPASPAPMAFEPPAAAPVFAEPEPRSPAPQANISAPAGSAGPRAPAPLEADESPVLRPAPPENEPLRSTSPEPPARSPAQSPAQSEEPPAVARPLAGHAAAFDAPQPVDPALVETVVDQLIERLRPQIEQATREMLRPVAESLLQREQEKAGERVRG